MANPILYVGNRNYSSWSMRPWLALFWSGLEFEDVLIDLDQEGYGNRQIKAVLKVSPTGTVPAMQHNNLKIWDSLAICEYIAEIAPNKLWPEEQNIRAHARALVCEVHSGFSNMRDKFTHNIRRIIDTPPINDACMIELLRLDEIFAGAYETFGGPYMYGKNPTIADAFYTPMAVRTRTYSLPLSTNARKMRDNLLDSDAFKAWCDLAQKEWKPFARAPHDTVYEK